MSKDEYEDRVTLQNHGWQAHKHTPYNSGSETITHSVLKTVVGHYLHHELEYRVNHEVTHDERGEIDVLAWGNPDRINPIAVEIESNIREDVIRSKLERYVHGTPIQECYILAVEDAPSDVSEMYAWVQDQL